jgi:hypothetical protein
MLRTQVLLEPLQYRFLKEQARHSGKSLSAQLRDILRSVMVPPQTRKKKLFEICGIITSANATGKEHDRYLYHHPCKNSS